MTQPLGSIWLKVNFEADFRCFWIQFSSPRLVAIPRLKKSFCLLFTLSWKNKRWILTSRYIVKINVIINPSNKYFIFQKIMLCDVTMKKKKNTSPVFGIGLVCDICSFFSRAKGRQLLLQLFTSQSQTQ